MDGVDKVYLLIGIGFAMFMGILIAQMSSTISDLQEENAQLKVELTTITANYNDLKAGYESASSTIDYKNESIESIKDLLKQCQSDLVSQRDKYVQVEQIMSNTNAEDNKSEDQPIEVKEVTNAQVKQSLILINSELTKLIGSIGQNDETDTTPAN